MSDEEQIVEAINGALVASESSEKVQNFCRIKELLLHKAPQLLSKYVSNVLNFATDKNQDVKKSLVGFIEDLCKIRESLIPNVMTTLHMLLCDESMQVQKRVIQAAISIYRRTLSWLCKVSSITDEMERAWNQLNQIKLEIANMIDSDNDGIRTSSVKFLECVILLQTYPDEAEKRPNDFSLDNVPLTLKIARRRKLEEEANNLFELLVKFHNSPHISSANLLACIGVLTILAKSRAEFMERVIDAIESLYNNLPPTLTTTQVSSVKKKLKTELAGLIKHPAAYEFAPRLAPLLIELGYVQAEISKMLPRSDERKKYLKRKKERTREDAANERLAKKSRLETKIDKDVPLDPMDYDNEIQEVIAPPPTPQEVNSRFIKDNLTIEKAIYLIITSIPKLPANMPASFAKEYGKYVTSGRIGRDYLAEVLAHQFVESKVGPGVNVVIPEEKHDSPKPAKPDKEKAKEPSKSREKEKDKQSDFNVVQPEAHVPIPEKVKIKTEKKEKVKTLRLAEITKPLSKSSKERLLVGAVKRLLHVEKMRGNQLHQKILTTLASNFSASVRETILTHFLSDIKCNVDTILAWLFEEYSIMQGFSRIPPLRKGVRPDECYNILLCTFIQSAAHDVLTLSRLILEVPLITEEALEEIKIICRDERRAAWALGLLRDLTLRKPPKQLMFLNALLLYTTYESSTIRESAIGHILDLHKTFNLRLIIEEFAKMNLSFLKLNKPPETLCGEGQGRIKSEFWSDDFIRACVLPYVSLLPANPSLIHELTKVYVETSADIKRLILRLVETPVKNMGMECPDLIRLVEHCPKGSETLVTRVIHILTEKIPPSPELVQKVKELYNTRISDVRFLIPVLGGLTKDEVIEALPKLIRLSPVVVREVFNRLFGMHGESPVSPVELLVALHLIESKQDIKPVIKAISICLQEKNIFTQEVIAVVLQQLMDQNPLPTLLMRTVIQALGSYPKLSGFVMNILQRLILKQVWKIKVVWEGFIKCCQRTKPQSFSVLMQLPPPQLLEVLTSCPDIARPLKDHLKSFTDAQRGHIPSAVVETVMNYTPPPVIPAPRESANDVMIVDVAVPPPTMGVSVLPPNMSMTAPPPNMGGMAVPPPIMKMESGITHVPPPQMVDNMGIPATMNMGPPPNIAPPPNMGHPINMGPPQNMGPPLNMGAPPQNFMSGMPPPHMGGPQMGGMGGASHMGDPQMMGMQPPIVQAEPLPPGME